MKTPLFSIAREKHLDHMVKVTPFIVCGYFIQCYFIHQSSLIEVASDTLFILGIGLIGMIAGFIYYDLKHKVHFHDTELEIHWFGVKKIAYQDILEVAVSEEDNSFAQLTILCANQKKYTFYFIDDAVKIRDWLRSNHKEQLDLAA